MLTFLAVYVITASLTLLAGLALAENPFAVLRGLATLIQISIAMHALVMLGLLIGAVRVYVRGGWSFEKRVGPITVRGWSKIPPAPRCMARPHRLRRH